VADYYLGVDYGIRRVAVALIDESNHIIVLQDLVLQKDARDAELDVLTRFVLDQVQTWLWDIVGCVIESPILGGSLNASTAVQMGITAGAISVTLNQHNVRNTFAPSASWKLGAIGRGNAKKEDVMAWAKETWPDQEFKTQDQADALAMAVYAHQKEEK
jgi:Holliday junction resolvasome RuvABC endonuclease subunit